MDFFGHDTGAATDPKVMRLRLECGGAAVDAYWYMLEQMHRDERGICIDDAGAMLVHCHTLCTDAETLGKWVEAMLSIGLFHTVENGREIVSARAMTNVEEYSKRKQKARSAAESRWGNADAEQPHKRAHSNRNAGGMPNKRKEKVSSPIKGTTNQPSGGVAPAAKAAPPPKVGKGWERTGVICMRCRSLKLRNPATGEEACPSCEPLAFARDAGGA